MNLDAPAHVVWDWNGTLFDDQHLVVDALNATLLDLGHDPTDVATYRRLYTRPVQRFYERLLGRMVDPDEWERIDEVYHAGYRAALHNANLTADAEHALDTLADWGATQSLLSMWRHHDLVGLVNQLGITERFVRIDGARTNSGGRKAPHLVDHLHALVHFAGDDPDRVVIVGDAIDDAAAAAHAGVRCVLYDGGAHPRAALEAVGVPVVDTLTDAVAVVRAL